MEYYLQKKLFELIEVKSKKMGGKHLSKVLNISRTTLRERIACRSPLTLNEAEILLRTFGFSWENLLGFPNQALAPEHHPPTLPTSFETAPEEYVSALSADLLALTQAPNARTWHECRAIPIFLLKHSRLLASFKFYFWFKTFHNNTNGHFPPFNTQWAEDVRIKGLLDQLKVALTAYQSISGVEFWSRCMFDRTLARIIYTQEIGGFAHASIVSQLLDEIQLVVSKMESMARAGNKAPDGSGAAMEVHDNHVFALSNTLTGTSDKQQLLYIDLGYPDFIRYEDNNMVQERARRFPFMIRHMESVTQSERGCNVFFRGLHEHLRQQIKILGI